MMRIHLLLCLLACSTTSAFVTPWRAVVDVVGGSAKCVDSSSESWLRLSKNEAIYDKPGDSVLIRSNNNRNKTIRQTSSGRFQKTLGWLVRRAFLFALALLLAVRQPVWAKAVATTQPASSLLSTALQKGAVALGTGGILFSVAKRRSSTPRPVPDNTASPKQSPINIEQDIQIVETGSADAASVSGQRTKTTPRPFSGNSVEITQPNGVLATHDDHSVKKTKPSTTTTTTTNIRKQYIPLQSSMQDSLLRQKYANIDNLEDRAFAILVDLGMAERTSDE